MSRPPIASLLVLVVAACAAPATLHAADRPAAAADPAATPEPTWHPAKGSEALRQLQEWVAARPAAGPTAQQIETDWAAADSWTGEDLLDRLAEVFAAVDPAAKELVSLCSHPRRGLNLPDFPWLADNATPAFERTNLRLLYGRWLVQANLYDEALAQLQSLRPEEVVDPAALLFYQSVVYHRLLKKEAGLGALLRLLEPGHEIPRRYQSVARLMQSDLAPLKDDSLDHIARRMEDIRRRLDLGRSGNQVREVEDGVIKSLDKLIEELEQQAAAAAAAAAQGGTNIVPVAPAQDSVPMGGKGPGNIVQRDIGHQSGWGDLPPRQRQEALQQIGKDFPAHYRDVIEQYFRKLATEDSQTPTGRSPAP
ncbi:MAG TPA: hypothetical protein VHY91_15905 [Pirellulales bacterium]|jgi:hypothetical protein|nr:hypothetical protein [Pirellulales bacterium]